MNKFFAGCMVFLTGFTSHSTKNELDLNVLFQSFHELPKISLSRYYYYLKPLENADDVIFFTGLKEIFMNHLKQYKKMRVSFEEGSFFVERIADRIEVHFFIGDGTAVTRAYELWLGTNRIGLLEKSPGACRELDAQSIARLRQVIEQGLRNPFLVTP